MRCQLKPEAGFTLVELLVVVAVVAMLAALVLPALSSAKAKAQRTVCTDNLRQINLGVRMYSDDAHDASPSPGRGGSNTPEALYFGYKALMKNYVGLHDASSRKDKLFQCPADVFFPSWVYTNATWPYSFVQKSLHGEPQLDYSSYAFNGGDNESHQMRLGGLIFTTPGLTDVKLSSVQHPARTVLVLETAATAPWSWHEPTSHGVAHQDGTKYNDSRNVVTFVDGHASYIKMYWNPGHGPACFYDPPPNYDYQWSPN